MKVGGGEGRQREKRKLYAGNAFSSTVGGAPPLNSVTSKWRHRKVKFALIAHPEICPPFAESGTYWNLFLFSFPSYRGMKWNPVCISTRSEEQLLNTFIRILSLSLDKPDWFVSQLKWSWHPYGPFPEINENVFPCKMFSFSFFYLVLYKDGKKSESQELHWVSLNRRQPTN